MATTAMQSLFESAGNIADKLDSGRYLSPGLRNSCYAYALHSPYVRDYFPDFYKPD